jgi:hypothetical protein
MVKREPGIFMLDITRPGLQQPILRLLCCQGRGCEMAPNAHLGFRGMV